MDPITAAVLVGGALLSAGGSYLSGTQAAKMSRAQFDASMKFNEKWNQKNFDQTEFWNRYAYQYASPVEQRKRLEAAGLNPSLMLGQFSTGFQGSPDTQSASMSAPSPQTFSLPNPVGEAAGSLAQLASAFAQISQSENTDAQTQRMKALLAGEIESLGLDNEAKQMANEIVRKYGYAKASEELALTSAKVAQTWAEYDLAIKNGEYTDELRNKTVEESKRIIEEAGLKKKEADYLQKQIDSYDEEFKKRMKEYDSRINANNASAEDSRAGAGLKRQMTQTEKENTRKAHWEKVAASWNALDAKTSAQLNKKYGSAERVQALISSEVENFSKSHKLANPSDIYNFGNKLYDNLLNKLGLSDYNGIDRTAVGRNLQQAIEDELRMRYDIYD